jgi:peptidoglycan/LPS O-acetylase OafA/YrhL
MAAPSVAHAHVQASAAGPRGRLYELDLLRLAAALSVVAVHFTSAGYGRGFSDVAFPELSPVTRYGYLGVDLFFLISGLVVLMSAWDRSASAFLIGRASRLFPAFWAAATITAVVGWWVGFQGQPAPSGTTFLANLTMVAPPVAGLPWVEAVYWTLWFEWRFYLILWLVALVGITRRRVEVLSWAWLAVAVPVSLLPDHSLAGRAATALAMPAAAHYFVAGMALFLLRRFGRSRGLLLLLGACYLQAVHVATAAAADGARFGGTTLEPVVIAAVVTGIFAVMTLVATGGLARWSRPWFSPLGALTYPLYLVHASIGYALFNALAGEVNRWLLLAGIVAGMCAAAWLMVTLVERRAQPVLRALLTRTWTRAGARRLLPNQ